VNKVLIVAPHPDDETLGCGGTIIKHKSKGDEIYWLIVTNISVEEGYDKDRVKERQKEIDVVSKEYGFKEIFKLDFLTTKLDMIPKVEIIKAISNVVCKVNAELIYVPNKNDVHSDHKITFE
jgi:LmbE family N-acetylglucosaminyl deacetylase